MQLQANGLRIEVDDQGSPAGEPLLLVMGLGMQLIAWPQPLVAALVQRGFRVIRMDNRDAGLSQGFDHVGAPNLLMASLRYLMHLPVDAPYSVADMARDAFGVLDALGLRAAHVCGASMGGMVAQHMAAMAPDRVKSLTLIMTTTGARQLPQTSARVRRALMAQPRDPRSRESIVDHLAGLWRLIGSPAYAPEPQALRRRLEASVARAWRPAGTARQMLAIVADGDRTPMLSRIVAPTHVIHGRADPLVPFAAGEDLQRRIAGATLDAVDGMGHDLPDALLPRFVDGITANARRAAAPAGASAGQAGDRAGPAEGRAAGEHPARHEGAGTLGQSSW